MHRVRFVRAAIVPLSAIAAVALAADEIHWTLTGPTSVTFDWRGADSTIQYGPTDEYGYTVTGVPPDPMPASSSGPFWEARITGLEPGAVYHYSIEGEADHTFRTAPEPSQNFVVCVEGDIGAADHYAPVPAIQDAIAKDDPWFVLMVGDLTYADDFGPEAVDRHFNDVMTWAREAAYMPAWGNHEWNPPDDMSNYKGRFDLPNPQASPNAPLEGCCGEDWYWFDCGNVRFIAYPEPYPRAWADWAPRARVLMDEAQADPAIRFIVTFGHRPAFSSGYHPGDAGLRGFLGSLGATHGKYVLNLNGHSHNYERSVAQSGVVHVTAGIGGSSLEQAPPPCAWTGGCPAPAWSAFRAFHHGALRLRFGRTSIRGTAICGPPSTGSGGVDDIACAPGDVFDAFTIGKDLPPQPSAPDTVTAGEGTLLRAAVHAEDPDGDPIEALTADLSALPPGNDAAFEADSGGGTGTLDWIPRPEDAGTWPVTFRAQNEVAGTTTTMLRVLPPPPIPAPGPFGLTLSSVGPNPATSSFRVNYSLESWAPARLELVDVAGRLRARRDLGAPGPGPHEGVLDRPNRARPGLYRLRLVQAGRSVSTGVVLLR